MFRKPIHKQVLIKWGERRAEVDEGIAPLILALWRLDIDTEMSCQENRPGIAWFMFPTFHDAREFLNRVAIHHDPADERMVEGVRFIGDIPYRHTLYARILGAGLPWDWEYDLPP